MTSEKKHRYPPIFFLDFKISCKDLQFPHSYYPRKNTPVLVGTVLNKIFPRARVGCDVIDIQHSNHKQTSNATKTFDLFRMHVTWWFHCNIAPWNWNFL